MKQAFIDPKDRLIIGAVDNNRERNQRLCHETTEVEIGFGYFLFINGSDFKYIFDGQNDPMIEPVEEIKPCKAMPQTNQNHNKNGQAGGYPAGWSSTGEEHENMISEKIT